MIHFLETDYFFQSLDSELAEFKHDTSIAYSMLKASRNQRTSREQNILSVTLSVDLLKTYSGLPSYTAREIAFVSGLGERTVKEMLRDPEFNNKARAMESREISGKYKQIGRAEETRIPILDSKFSRRGAIEGRPSKRYEDKYGGAPGLIGKIDGILDEIRPTLLRSQAFVEELDVLRNSCEVEDKSVLRIIRSVIENSEHLAAVVSTIANGLIVHYSSLEMGCILSDMRDRFTRLKQVMNSILEEYERVRPALTNPKDLEIRKEFDKLEKNDRVSSLLRFSQLEDSEKDKFIRRIFSDWLVGLDSKLWEIRRIIDRASDSGSVVKDIFLFIKNDVEQLIVRAVHEWQPIPISPTTTRPGSTSWHPLLDQLESQGYVVDQ
jgi:hypothetical protein